MRMVLSSKVPQHSNQQNFCLLFWVVCFPLICAIVPQCFNKIGERSSVVWSIAIHQQWCQSWFCIADLGLRHAVLAGINQDRGDRVGFALQIWDYVMPYWLESIRTEVPEEDLAELKVLLRSELCPVTLLVSWSFQPPWWWTQNLGAPSPNGFPGLNKAPSSERTSTWAMSFLPS